MMDLVEELCKRLAQKICGSMVIPYQGKQIDICLLYTSRCV